MTINKHNNSKLQKITTIALLFLSLLISGGNMANAQNENSDPYIDGNLSIARCIDNGNTEFMLFINSLIWDDGLYDGFVEPWNDVIYRNQCQAGDVAGLIKQRDKVRDHIRNSFLSCKTDIIPTLKRAYYELNAEIYYVRKVVDAYAILGLPYVSFDVLNYSYVYPKDKLYNEMKKKYVGGNITQEKFDILFRRFEAKYSHRVKTYIVCENSSWDLVAEKWDEFVDNVGGLKDGWDSMKKGVGSRVEKLVEATTDFSYVDWYSSFIQLNINNSRPLAGITELWDYAVEGLIIPDYSTPTYSTLTQMFSEDNFEFEINKIRNELYSGYTVLYRDTSDSGLQNILFELDVLDSTLKQTFTPLDKVYECSLLMNAKQCPGK